MHIPSVEDHRKGRWGFTDISDETSSNSDDDATNEVLVRVAFNGHPPSAANDGAESENDERREPSDGEQLGICLRSSMSTERRRFGTGCATLFLVAVVALAIAVNNTRPLVNAVSPLPWLPAPSELGWPMPAAVIRGLGINNRTSPNATCLEWDACCSTQEVGMYAGVLFLLVVFLGLMAVPAGWVAARDTKKHSSMAADNRAALAVYCGYMVCPFVTVYLPTVVACLVLCMQASTTQLLLFARMSVWEGTAFAAWCAFLAISSACIRRRRTTTVAVAMTLTHVVWAAAGVVLPSAVGNIQRPNAGDPWGKMYQLTAADARRQPGYPSYHGGDGNTNATSGTMTAVDADALERMKCHPAEAVYYGVSTLFYTGAFLGVIAVMLRRDYNLRNVLLCLGTVFGGFVVSIGSWHSCVQWRDGGAAARFLGGIFLFSLPVIVWGIFATRNRSRNRRNLERALDEAAGEGRSGASE